MSVIIEALARGIGSGYPENPITRGHIFTAIDPTGYCPIEEFKNRIDAMIRDIKSSAKRPGFNEILLPGEPEWIKEEKARKEGVYMDDPWWQSIVDTAKELGINVNAVMKSINRSLPERDFQNKVVREILETKPVPTWELEKKKMDTNITSL